ncbi:hypothetical protein [Lysinibacillus sp. BW-2-10]|uniref:hypothetical protein n=1 Tax=Lysinibacillus sp. BW-2-10 TaxID=2590030 RepID=UPI0011815F46|nr:hypothetical protein [Lysinibacillus sp. BW-2-10]TSI05765.1 hypothetical protein FJQ64_11780 [Lysinibacillus sp. BW-2-10]
MNENSIKVLSKNRFYIFISLFVAFLLIDTLFGLNIIVKMHDNWYESTSGIITVSLLTVLMVGFFNSFISRIYLYNDFIYIKTLFKKKKIYYKDIKELDFGSSGSPQNFYFVLYGEGGKVLGIIQLQYDLGKLNQQKDFINFIKNHQPNIKLDKNCERLLQR